MGYELHIEADGGIDLRAWLEAIDTLDGIEEDSEALSATNPTTGEVISMPGQQGDACGEVDGTREKTFRWFEGRVSFRYSSDLENPQHPVRLAAIALAQRIGARIVGDEGEGHWV